MKFFVVVLEDEPRESLSLWSTRELAQAEIDRQLGLVSGRNYYWLLNRLAIEEFSLDVSSENVL